MDDESKDTQTEREAGFFAILSNMFEELFMMGCGCLVLIIGLFVLVALVKWMWNAAP